MNLLPQQSKQTQEVRLSYRYVSPAHLIYLVRHTDRNARIRLPLVLFPAPEVTCQQRKKSTKPQKLKQLFRLLSSHVRQHRLHSASTVKQITLLGYSLITDHSRFYLGINCQKWILKVNHCQAALCWQV